MNKVHLEKIETLGKIAVWLVNGQKIRMNKGGDQFTNFGQHYRFPFIPEHEFWLDKETHPDERRFFIDHLLTKYKLMQEGMDYDEAIDWANAQERTERLKAKSIHEILEKVNFLPPNSVHERKIGETKNSVSVWVVDGRMVRSAYFIDFTEGGHDLVYSFVPNKQVWLDNDLKAAERLFVLLHELYERSLMKKGLTYPHAHAHASQLEWNCRHDLEKLKERLLEQGWELNGKNL